MHKGSLPKLSYRENYICFIRGYSENGGVQKQYKEELVKDVTKHLKTINPNKQHTESLYEKMKKKELVSGIYQLRGKFVCWSDAKSGTRIKHIVLLDMRGRSNDWTVAMERGRAKARPIINLE